MTCGPTIDSSDADAGRGLRTGVGRHGGLRPASMLGDTYGNLHRFPRATMCSPRQSLSRRAWPTFVATPRHQPQPRELQTSNHESRQIKCDTVALDFARISLETNDSAPKKVRQIFTPLPPRPSPKLPRFTRHTMPSPLSPNSMKTKDRAPNEMSQFFRPASSEFSAFPGPRR